ncbi:MAG: hypothetical protein IKN56_08070 [Clostridia bacterium]|nr:hypothetical protein [Clostridia bacterium]MBR6360862.1 hypothetical protein [Clostridia bacterium]MBR6702459.1 hypothetical protein [Clostridia bacterium]
MDISFEGYDNSAVTFMAEDNVVPGMPVSLSDSFTVQRAQPGDSVIGIALTVRGGYAAVQTRGIIRYRCVDGTEPGWARLTVDNKGALSYESEDGPERLVAGVETTQSGSIATVLF